MQLKRALALALCPAAVAAVNLAKVDPADLELALNARREAPESDTACRSHITPKMCEESTGPGNHYSAHAVVSTFQEDLHWLNEMPWSDNITVMVHDRAARRTHESVMQIQDNNIIAEESEVKVKALNPRRKNPIKFQDIPNKGDEGAAYLQWIIEHYDHLPDVTFFIQGHRCADHAKFDMATALPNVRACFNPDQGYLDLNAYHHGAHGVKTKCKKTKELLEKPVTGFHLEKFGNIWTEMFHKEIGAMPVRICWDAYAQFAVSRDTIRRHPKDFYQTLHKGVTSGITTMEFFWRPIFVPWAMSWEEGPKKDRMGRVIKPEPVFSPEEIIERTRHIDLRGQVKQRPGVL